MFDFFHSPTATAARVVGPALSGQFTDGEIASMARLGTVVHVASGDNLITEGSPGSHAFFITTGTASVKRNAEVVATLKSGDLVGERALVTGSARNATVTAMMPVTALRFDARQFAWLRLESRKVKSLSNDLVEARG